MYISDISSTLSYFRSIFLKFEFRIHLKYNLHHFRIYWFSNYYWLPSYCVIVSLHTLHRKIRWTANTYTKFLFPSFSSLESDEPPRNVTGYWIIHRPKNRHLNNYAVGTQKKRRCMSSRSNVILNFVFLRFSDDLPDKKVSFNSSRSIWINLEKFNDLLVRMNERTKLSKWTRCPIPNRGSPIPLGYFQWSPFF